MKIESGIAVCCKNKQETLSVMKKAEWEIWTPPQDNYEKMCEFIFNNCDGEPCLSNMSYCDKNWYIRNDYKIITADEYLGYKKGETKMSIPKVIADSYKETKDAVLVDKWFSKYVNIEDKRDNLLFKLHAVDFLKEAKRLQKEEDDKE
jgi:hypothetical protein